MVTDAGLSARAQRSSQWRRQMRRLRLLLLLMA
jgi:hypothetical protein